MAWNSWCEDLIGAIGESVSNAWIHGCRARIGRPIKVIAKASPSSVSVEVWDTGDGFDQDSMPFRMDTCDGVLVCYSGRFLMSKACDVRYRHVAGHILRGGLHPLAIFPQSFAQLLSSLNAEF